MTQEALFQDLKVFIMKTFDEKFEEKFEKKFEEKFEKKFDEKFDEKFSGVKRLFQVEFDGIRYKMADMQSDITRIDQKIDDNTSILRTDIASIKKMFTDDIHALGKDVTMLKRRIKKPEGQKVS